MDTRLEKLSTWLSSVLKHQTYDISVASADASFRRYFRVTLTDNSLIAMDAPPDKEDCKPFVKLANALSLLGVHTPKVLDQDLTNGFLLLEDLGSIDYLSELSTVDRAEKLYRDALDTLINIQKGDVNQAAKYSTDMLKQEMTLFIDWYMQRHLGESLSEHQVETWQNLEDLLCNTCTKQPQVWVHRDFHSRNLMVTPEHNPGVIDFQDLVTGPISYDLVSLFKDCYIEWPRSQQLVWLRVFYTRLTHANFEFSQLVEWYDLTGLQRHLKVLGIFCRLNYRDAKPHYLSDLPLVARYTLEALDLYEDKYTAIKAFKQAFSTHIEQHAQ